MNVVVGSGAAVSVEAMRIELMRVRGRRAALASADRVLEQARLIGTYERT